MLSLGPAGVESPNWFSTSSDPASVFISTVSTTVECRNEYDVSSHDTKPPFWSFLIKLAMNLIFHLMSIGFLILLFIHSIIELLIQIKCQFSAKKNLKNQPNKLNFTQYNYYSAEFRTIIT